VADVSVRPAQAGDAAELGRIQVETWRWGYRTVLPRAVLDALDADAAAAAWREAISSPPGPGHRVLVAAEGPTVVGFAAFGPSEEQEPDDPSAAVAVAALLVEPRWQRRGHGSRLMAAVTDLAREAGAGDALMWIPEADTVTREFLVGAGWLPDGRGRGLDTGAGELREIRLHTGLSDGAVPGTG
jgi:GNAT superfamily N-acetyltransferase